MQRYTTLRRTRSVETLVFQTIEESLVFPVFPQHSIEMAMRESGQRYLDTIEEDDNSESENNSESEAVTEEDGSECDKSVKPDTVDFLGYHWGPNCRNKYWIIWTIWEPKLLRTLEQFSRMRKDHFSPMRIAQFEEIVNNRMQSNCSDSDYRIVNTPESNCILLRIEKDPNNERYNPRTGMAELESTEVYFNESQGTSSLRFRQTYIVASSGLAEILSSICNPKDLLIISGSFKRAYRSDGAYFLLLNFDNDEGLLQIIRVSFSSKPDNEVRLIEKIKPTQQDNRYLFKYVATSPNGSCSKEISIHQDFNLIGTASNFRQYAKRLIPISEIPAPIRDCDDIFYVYRTVLTHRLHNIPPPTSPPNQVLYSRKSEKSASLSQIPEFVGDNQAKLQNDDAPDSIRDDPYAKDMPVFRMQPKTQRSSKIPLFQKDYLKYSSDAQKAKYYSDMRKKNRRSAEGAKSKRSKSYSRFLQWPIQLWKSFQWGKFVNFINYEKLSCAFVFVAKVSLLMFFFVALLAFYNVIVNPNPTCPSNNPKEKFLNELSGDTSTIEDHLKNAHTQSVLVKFRAMLVNFLKWIEESCGWDCLLKRLGFEVTSHPPIV